MGEVDGREYIKYGSKQQVTAHVILKDDAVVLTINNFLIETCQEHKRDELKRKVMRLLRGEMYKNTVDPFLESIHKRHGGIK